MAPTVKDSSDSGASVTAEFGVAHELPGEVVSEAHDDPPSVPSVSARIKKIIELLLVDAK